MRSAVIPVALAAATLLLTGCAPVTADDVRTKLLDAGSAECTDVAADAGEGWSGERVRCENPVVSDHKVQVWVVGDVDPLIRELTAPVAVGDGWVGVMLGEDGVEGRAETVAWLQETLGGDVIEE